MRIRCCSSDVCSSDLLLRRGTGPAPVVVGTVGAGDVGGIGRLTIEGGGTVDFLDTFDGALDLGVRAGGDVTFHEDVGMQKRLGDVVLTPEGDVLIERMFVAGDVTVDIGGTFRHVNQIGRASCRERVSQTV